MYNFNLFTLPQFLYLGFILCFAIGGKYSMNIIKYYFNVCLEPDAYKNIYFRFSTQYLLQNLAPVVT